MYNCYNGYELSDSNDRYIIIMIIIITQMYYDTCIIIKELCLLACLLARMVTPNYFFRINAYLK